MAVDLICKKVAEDICVSSDPKTEEKDDPVIVCRNCSGLVTRPEHRIEINGGFIHTFANPHGQVFEIGCFSSAQGCVKASESTDEFSWFKGYVWAIGLCRNCHIQIGWVFLPTGAKGSPMENQSVFYGLILDKLVFP